MTAGSERPGAMAERMQDLLSRAVEDQLSEQRQLTTALAEIREQVARIPDELGADPAGIRAALQELSRSVDGLAAEVRDAVASAVASAVAAAVAESERRLSAHVDEAVLALAEALLRRRPRSGQVVAPGEDDLAERAEPQAPVTPAASALAELAHDLEPPDDEPGADDEPPTAPPPETPGPAREELDHGWLQQLHDEPSPSDPGRRRPWWRPSE